MKKLVGRNDIEDALKRLDKLTQDEARMAIAENLKVTHDVENKLKEVINDAQSRRQAALDLDEMKRLSSLHLHFCQFQSLKCACREAIATRALEVALSTRSLDKSQYCLQFSS